MIFGKNTIKSIFAFFPALKISFLLLHHVNSTRLSICSKQVGKLLVSSTFYIVHSNVMLWPLITKVVKHLSQRENSMSMVRFGKTFDNARISLQKVDQTLSSQYFVGHSCPDSEIREIFACQESRVLCFGRIQVKESLTLLKIRWLGIRNPVPGIRNPQHEIQNLKLS